MHASHEISRPFHHIVNHGVVVGKFNIGKQLQISLFPRYVFYFAAPHFIIFINGNINSQLRFKSQIFPFNRRIRKTMSTFIKITILCHGLVRGGKIFPSVHILHIDISTLSIHGQGVITVTRDTSFPRVAVK